ncbi:MAG TPA: efflux RND transporter periplasmic adaptor subunit [Gemmatimonadaceae bacterium]|nr:efflux RND transporter periplasmic adaptor subunit [Gemmatimonadaceae bacterium]
MKFRTLITLAAVGALAACDRTEAPEPAAAAQTGRAAGPGGGGAGATPGRGRGPTTLTLAASDVSVVQPTTIEDVASISGDLHPIETVAVRSRIEGDLDAVTVREGDVVRAGQVLARFDADEQESALRSAEADRAAAQSDLANAQWNAEQSAQLFKAGAIAERDHKTAQQSVVTMRARLAAAESRLRTMSTVVRDTRVIAPTTGIVSKRLVENGEHVSRGAAMFEIVRNDMLELVAAVPARAAGAVRVGQPVRFVADGRTFGGRVARLSPTIDPTTRSITVYVEVPNPSGAIRGGTFATGQVVSRTVSDVIAIPRDAIHYTPDGTSQYAYRIVNDAIEFAMLRTGVTDERLGLVEILDGLKPGDRIITGNVGNVGRGMRVSILGGEGGRRGAGAGGRGRAAGTP